MTDESSVKLNGGLHGILSVTR